ncbi:MAG: DNA polymerase III subunit delta [Legionella sp.]|nr:DNA polymerase III subunit delta [Legionella sp.]
MIIKQSAFQKHLTTNRLFGAYLFLGAEPFLIQQAALMLQKVWIADTLTSSTIRLSIETPSDWDDFTLHTQSSSLFTPRILIDLRYDKKTLDAPGKHALLHYLKTCPTHCLLMISAPQLTMTQLSSLKTIENLHITAFYPLSSTEMRHWIKKEFDRLKLSVELGVVQLIMDHTQGNMSACAQAIEKISLIAGDAKKITMGDAKSQLFDQAQHQLSELSESWLVGNKPILIRQLKYVYDAGIEPRTLLWMLTQDIRQLLQLNALILKGMPYDQACRNLNVWSSKMKIFQQALKTKSQSLLIRLLQCCQTLDLKMKTEKNLEIYHCIDQIALSLCLDEPVGLSWEQQPIFIESNRTSL